MFIFRHLLFFIIFQIFSFFRVFSFIYHFLVLKLIKFGKYLLKGILYAIFQILRHILNFIFGLIRNPTAITLLDIWLIFITLFQFSLILFIFLSSITSQFLLLFQKFLFFNLCFGLLFSTSL